MARALVPVPEKVLALAPGRAWGSVLGQGPALAQERVLALGWAWAQEAPARAPEPGQERAPESEPAKVPELAVLARG